MFHSYKQRIGYGKESGSQIAESTINLREQIYQKGKKIGNPGL